MQKRMGIFHLSIIKSYHSIYMNTLTGYDSTNKMHRPLLCDTDGNLKVDIGSTVLATGSATSALQTSGNASLTTIATDTTSINSKITACDTSGVVISSSALPSGCSTSALQSTCNSTLSTMSNNIGLFGTSGTFWDSASPTSGTNSASVDVQFCKSITIMGLETIGSPTLSVYASHDNSSWYNTQESIMVTGASPYYQILANNFNARYIRLQTNADCTSITAICVAKM